ncbi:MAG: anthranilate synthase component I family protein [Aquabacterium sp.]|uniref:anthranilate synthase component I family protein n=1 Tax=Aquabacterium sp. TaxID=1872578 RepID=UPI0025C6C826|nr:anthranilate synthase component I family protein [Aquabacterium sp.]MBI3381921.1 anthranilate synthase component I family protein [Aquabacterium sp.]
MLTLNIHDYTEVSIDGIDLRPFAYPVYARLRKQFDRDEVFLLESLGRNAVDARTSMVGVAPFLTISAYAGHVELQADEACLNGLMAGLKGSYQIHDGIMKIPLEGDGAIWDVLRNIEQAMTYPASRSGMCPLMFGYFSYDTIHYVERIGDAPKAESAPRIQLKLYETIITLMEQGFSILTYAPGKARVPDAAELARVVMGMVQDAQSQATEMPQVPVKIAVNRETSKDSYLSKARIALEHIRIGDIYQVQIGQKIEVVSPAEPEVVYERMRISNPSPYMYLFEVDGRTVVGASPELFVRIDEGDILMRPIAGTLGKKDGLNHDAAARHLRSDEKEVAEHMMLVDLCRNDLHRVSQAESVKVSDLMGIEEYSHVWHMVSTTRGKLDVKKDKYDVIAASFPAGTMTGTPKIRAMEIIQENEDSDRGLYAGAVGVLGVGVNKINTALCIRTAVHRNGIYSLRASAGIVADSEPDREYLETLHKMGAVYRAVTGEELV